LSFGFNHSNQQSAVSSKLVLSEDCEGDAISFVRDDLPNADDHAAMEDFPHNIIFSLIPGYSSESRHAGKDGSSWSDEGLDMPVAST